MDGGNVKVCHVADLHVMIESNFSPGFTTCFGLAH
jgi:hypothetical protein